MQKELVEFHHKFGIHVTAYAPIGSAGSGVRGPDLKELNLLKEKVIEDLAAKY